MCVEFGYFGNNVYFGCTLLIEHFYVMSFVNRFASYDHLMAFCL